MRKINKIVLHCSATRGTQTVMIADVTRWHRAKGWSTVGYHRFITLDGVIEVGRDYAETGAGVFGHNADSIHICYAGGLDANGKAADTRTPRQKDAMERLVRELHARFPAAKIMGHRDLSPDRNGDGKITRNEWLKECPCFDVAEWVAGLKL
jgi:N-acetylmuramoyl-L-alanine amidase